jgi:putative transcriptional regulator
MMSRVIYNRIALFRTDRKLSRKALADAVGVNPQTIGFLERGDYKPSLELAMNLSVTLGASLDMLFSFRPFPPVADALRSAGD